MKITPFFIQQYIFTDFPSAPSLLVRWASTAVPGMLWGTLHRVPCCGVQGETQPAQPCPDLTRVKRKLNIR